jgi:hypothetical protein
VRPLRAGLPTEANRQLAHADPVLGRIMARVGPGALQPRRRSPYQSLVQAIIVIIVHAKARPASAGRTAQEGKVGRAQSKA